MNKDLIKYGLIALGAYLLYKYIQDHGGLDGVFGTVVTGTGTQPAGTISTGTGLQIPHTQTGTTQPATGTQVTQQPAPVLDMRGLVVTPDVNDSLTGVVKINGVPVRISIITSDGRIFGEQGTQIEDSLIASGVNLATLRAAFRSAPMASAQATGELAGLGWASPWMMQ